MNGNNHYRTALYADYLITGVLKVVKKDNYLLFSNPGSLRIPVEKDLQGRLFKVTQSQNSEHVPNDRLRREHWLRLPNHIKGLERRKMARARYINIRKTLK